MFVFAIQETGVTLRGLRDALIAAGHPVSISTGIAGEAADEDLDARDWESAFARWNEPEVHDVYFLLRDRLGGEEDADRVYAEVARLVHNRPESADKLIVADHLRRSRTLYEIQLLPILEADEDHAAWGALDVLLRHLAEATDGLIYAEGTGFFDAEGEPLLPEETVDEDSVPFETD